MLRTGEYTFAGSPQVYTPQGAGSRSKALRTNEFALLLTPVARLGGEPDNLPKPGAVSTVVVRRFEESSPPSRTRLFGPTKPHKPAPTRERIAHPPYLFVGQQDPVSRSAWGTAILTGLPDPRNSLTQRELFASVGRRVRASPHLPLFAVHHERFQRALRASAHHETGVGRNEW